MLNLFFGLGLLSCHETPRSTDWIVEFEHHPKNALEMLSQVSDVEQADLVRLQLIQAFPESASEICNDAESKTLKSQCERFKQRPHLWTIKPEENNHMWKGGAFNERVYFPNQLISKSPQIDCALDDITCISKSIEGALDNKDTETISKACFSYSTKRGQFDCFFRTAEFWVDRYGGYSIPAHLCQNAGSYSAECHHHVLLGLAVRFQMNGQHHQVVIDEMTQHWVDHPLYSDELHNLYWAIVASRVAGVVQPFRWEEWSFLPQHHLHSAIGLRLIREDNPLESLNLMMRQSEIQLEKAYGPGTPHFQPHHVWGAKAEASLYFCDIRGGRRPVQDDVKTDIQIAIMTAAAMVHPVRKKLIFEIAQQNQKLSAYAETLMENL